MKRLLPLLLVLVWLQCAHAAEPQLDHAFGPSTFSSQVLAFSPDATKLAVAGSDGVKVYDCANWQVLQTRPACRWRTSCVAWSSDGKSLAAGGMTVGSEPMGEIWLWKEGSSPIHWTTASADVVSLAFSPNGKTLASASAGTLLHESTGGEARVWDASSGAFVRTLGSYDADNAHVAYAPDGQTVAFSNENDAVDKEETALCSATSGRVLKRWDRAIAPLEFDANNSVITQPVPLVYRRKKGIECRVDAVSGDDYLQLHFSARKAGYATELTGQDLGDAVPCAVLGGDLLAVIAMKRVGSGFEPSVDIWQLLGSPPRATFWRSLGDRTAGARALSVSGDGHTLGISTRLGTALLDASTLRLRRMVAAKSLGTSIEMSRDGKRMFDGQWLDISNGTPRVVRSKHDGDIPSVFGLSTNGQVLCGCFGESYGLLRERGLPTSFKVPAVAGGAPESDRKIGVAQMVTWSPDNTRVAVIGSLNSERQLFVFDEQGRFESEIGNKATGAGGSIFQAYGAVAFSPDGTHLATAGYGGIGAGKYGPRLDIWDVFTSQHLRGIVLPGSGGKAFGGGQVSSIGYSPDGQTIAVGGILSENGLLAPRLLLFDAYTGSRIGAIPLRDWESTTNQTWAFLDSKRVAILNGNALEVWDVKWRVREKSLLLMMQGRVLKVAGVNQRMEG